MMNWNRFLESLASPGGHMFVLGVAVLIGGLMACRGVTEGRDLMVGAGGALLALLRPQAET
jgi:hypothetical protein